MVRTGKIEQSQDTTPPTTTTTATYLPKCNTQLFHLFPLTQLKYLIEISYMRELNNKHTIVKPSSTRKNTNHKKQAHQFWCKR
jgi:hypothetical protein